METISNKTKAVKVYLFQRDGAADFDHFRATRVFSTFEKAKEALDSFIFTMEESDMISEDWIVEESDTSYSAYLKGNYNENHEDAWIEEKEIL